MKKLIVKQKNCLTSLMAILLILLSTSCYAINPLDKIAPNDKQLHFMANYILTDVSQQGWQLEWWQSLLLVEGLSRFKESLDVAFGGKWDMTDIYANRTGWATYNLIHLQINF